MASAVPVQIKLNWLKKAQRYDCSFFKIFYATIEKLNYTKRAAYRLNLFQKSNLLNGQIPCYCLPTEGALPPPPPLLPLLLLLPDELALVKNCCFLVNHMFLKRLLSLPELYVDLGGLWYLMTGLAYIIIIISSEYSFEYWCC